MTHYVLQGTHGAYLSARRPHGEDPLVWIKGRSPGAPSGQEEWQSLWDYAAEFEQPQWQARGAVATAAGLGNGAYFVVEDFLDAVDRRILPPIDVYDAVTWSSIYALSAASAQDGGRPQAIPDFRARTRHP
jgi:hypothetical protein